MKTAIFLSIRDKATRLPKKVLRLVCGKTMTEHLIDRLQRAEEPDLLVMCTSSHPDDLVLCDIARKMGIHYFCGSEDDKLVRYRDAARAFDVEFFTVVDADDIFCSVEYIDRAVREYRQTGADYIVGEDLPFGATPFGVKARAMEKVCRLKKEIDTEVWGGYFTETDLFKVHYLPITDERFRHPEYRMTLDYPEDLEFFNTVFEALYKSGEVFSFGELMDYLNSHPEVVGINAGVQEKYKYHLGKSAPAEINNWRVKVKVLVAGLGSMGKRRIRCLKALGVRDITGFDPRRDRRDEAAWKYGIKTFAAFSKALKLNPDLMIISTPPDRHREYALYAAEKGIHFFVEAGVLKEDYDRLEQLAKKNNCIAAPSCTMRFFQGPKKTRQLIESGAIGRPCTFTYHSAQYLPDWHPWEDIRDFYVSNPVTGGCREIVPFELIWLNDIFGPFERVKSFHGKVGELPVEIDDVYHLLLSSRGGKLLGHLTVDVLASPAVRHLRVVGTLGQLVWDAGEKCVYWYTLEDDKWNHWLEESGTVEKGYINLEEPYIEEIDRFLTAAEGKAPYGYTFGEDMRILDLLYSAEKDDNCIPEEK